MTAADRDHIVHRLAHALPSGGEDRHVNLSAAAVELLRELVEREPPTTARYLINAQMQRDDDAAMACRIARIAVGD